MPRPKKDNKRVILSITVDPEIYVSLKQEAEKAKIPIARYAGNILEANIGNKDIIISKPDTHRPENNTYKDIIISKPPNEEQDWTSRTIITVYNEQISVLDFMNRCIPRPSLNALRALREHSSWEEIADSRWPKNKNWKDTPIRV